MRQLSFKRHRFSANIIRYSVWLYARFSLSFRDVEEMLGERGLLVKRLGRRGRRFHGTARLRHPDRTISARPP